MAEELYSARACFDWREVFVYGPYDAILCLTLLHIFFSGLCKGLESGGPVGSLKPGGYGVYWMAIRI